MREQGPRELRPCAAEACPENVLENRVFCPNHWNLLGEEMQHQIADAILAKDAPKVAELTQLAVARIAAAEIRWAKRRSDRQKRADLD